MLDLAVLGLLQQGELHGYEIRRLVRNRLGMLANVSFGSIYPALARLEAAHAVVAVEVPSPRPATATPATGSLTGELAVLRSRRRGPAAGRRSRKAYRITDEGRRRFAELLSGGPDDDRSFDLRLSFARHLAPQGRLALLDRRRGLLAERLAEARAAASDPDLDQYARSVVEHAADGVEQDLRWLDRLRAAEGRGRRGTDPAARADERPTDRVDHLKGAPP